MVKEKLEALLEEFFKDEEWNDCFVTEVKQNNTKVEVFVDSEDYLSLDKCRKISRFLESHLDEKQWLGEKYTLDVSSPGATNPLVNKRQYKKHIGRKVEVKWGEQEKTKGKFEKFENDVVFVSYTKTTKQGKKKIKEEITDEIPFEQIKEFKIKLSFN